MRTLGIVNEQTSITTIKELAFEDFGVELTNEQGRQIQIAALRGALVWTYEHIITTDDSQLHIKRQD